MRVVLTIVALILVLVAANAAPAAARPRFLFSDSVTFRPLHPEYAQVYLVREQFVRARHLPPEHVFLDGEPVGLLPQQSWFMMWVDPGRHCLWGIKGCADLWFDVEPGRAYLLRLRELVDAHDVSSAQILFDDPTKVRHLVEKQRLPYVTTTDVGFRYLLRKLRSVPHDPRAEAVGTNTMAPAPADTFDSIICEHPLDPINLETDFWNLQGQLILDADAIHYRMAVRLRTSLISWKWMRDSVDIRVSDILCVRYGGTRFTGVIPWISIIFQTPERGPRMVSFADVRERCAVESYNRMFNAVCNMVEHDRRRPGFESESQ